MTDNGLSGKKAIVTGASSGIGYATALELARWGAAVVISGRRGDRLDNLAREIAAQGGRALAVAGDASVEADIDRLFDAALAWADGGAGVDILVANAGRGLAGGILDSDASRWREVYEINVLGTTHLLRRAARYMVQRKGGDIVVIGSVVGRNVSPFSGYYGSSKFAIGAVAEGLRREVCPHGVRVALVMPGVVLSEFQDVAGYNAENFGNAIAHFGKLLEPLAIAEGIRWLLTLPPHVNVSEIMIRPTGQHYP
ncbi:MAG: SDR family oxidoreductase [Syntrophobacteraceae bacterium]|jgi:NADP-dependent 3-hydroxy acid dehydrogenase YdfG|nr:SDR family oxidoreductase [Syntrophobacteraceae bacterium]